MRRRRMAMLLGAGLLALAGCGPRYDMGDLARLTPGRTFADNGLWIETPKERQFQTSKRVVVGEATGPGFVTMIHFAMPQRWAAKPTEYVLGRELLIRMYWDGEATPSVDCPFVDFFCDPAGYRDRIDTALVNKKRGWNAYFPMPFRKSARIELVYEGPVEPGQELWELMPCYSYVMFQKTDRIPDDAGYLHAQWRQELLNLGARDYVALEATGRGKFVGWNVTMRLPGRPGYPVDQNERFYIDGEPEPSVEFQGIEDSFGFSWGFPTDGENLFPMMGWFPFKKEGAAAYRFFVHDPICFEKSLKVAIGFGQNEHPMFREQFGAEGNELEFSSTCYWYQTEPHAAFPAMPPPEKRAPSALTWKDKEQLPSVEELKRLGVRLEMRCGRPEQEVVLAEPGYGATVQAGYEFAGWPFPVFHTRADGNEVRIDLAVPKGAAGTVRLFVVDPDRFAGGREQEIFVAGRSLGVVKDFVKGKWIETSVSGDETAEGRVPIRLVNRKPGANAVVSILEWVEPPP